MIKLIMEFIVDDNPQRLKELRKFTRSKILTGMVAETIENYASEDRAKGIGKKYLKAYQTKWEYDEND